MHNISHHTIRPLVTQISSYLLVLLIATHAPALADRLNADMNELFIRQEDKIASFEIDIEYPEHRRHSELQSDFVFMSLLGSILSDMLRARTLGACLSTISPSDLVQLSGVIYTNRSHVPRGALRSMCVQELLFVLQSANVSIDATRKQITKMSTDYFDRLHPQSRHLALSFFAATRVAYLHIYLQNSFAHSILSVDDNSFRSTRATDFVAWLQRKRYARELSLRMTEEEKVDQNDGTRIYPTGDTHVSARQAGGLIQISNAYSIYHSLIFIYLDPAVLKDGRINNSVTDRYCGKKIGVANATTQLKCWFTAMFGTDVWMVFYVENPEHVSRSEIIELMRIIGNDPEVVDFARKSGSKESEGDIYCVVFSDGS